MERVNFKHHPDDLLQYLLLETVYKLVLEHLTARSLYCGISGHVVRVQYSLLVEAVLSAGDIIVHNIFFSINIHSITKLCLYS